MKTKKEYILLIAIIIALSLYLGLHKRGKVHYSLPVLNEVPLKDVTTLSLFRKGERITLTKDKGTWKISPENYPANDAMVKNMVKSICSLKVTALASEAKDYSRYNLGKENKIEVILKKGDEVLRSVDVGKVASSFHHTFVRLENNPGVYHAEGNLRRLFDRGKEEIRDKTVLTVSGKVTELTAIQGKKRQVLRRVEKMRDRGSMEKEKTKKVVKSPASTWVNSLGKRAKNSEVERIITILSPLTCDGFLKGKKADFKNPIYSLTLKGAENYHLEIFNKKGNRFPATSSMSDYPFTLSEWRAKQIMKDPDSLLEKEGEKK